MRKALEYLASGTGIVGALLMALMVNPAAAFALFVVSNVAWLAFARMNGHRGLAVQQGLFLAFSLLGLWNAWLGPRLLG